MDREDNKIYYVGLSDGGNRDKMHYICMYSEIEEEIINWCNAVSLKYPESDSTYIKMTGKFFKEFEKIYFAEYNRLNDIIG